MRTSPSSRRPRRALTSAAASAAAAADGAAAGRRRAPRRGGASDERGRVELDRYRGELSSKDYTLFLTKCEAASPSLCDVRLSDGREVCLELNVQNHADVWRWDGESDLEEDAYDELVGTKARE